MSEVERQSPENGLWLCPGCATEIDKDPQRFPVSLLRSWKLDAEAEALELLAKPSYGRLRIPHPAFVAPIEYQRDALRQIVDGLRHSGQTKVSVSQLAQVMPNPLLRDGINPIYEPLSVESVVDAIDEFVGSGELQLDGQMIVLDPAVIGAAEGDKE